MPWNETPAAAEREAAPAPERAERPRRERRPRQDDAAANDEAPTALPGFLTRSAAAPAEVPAAETQAGGEAGAPAPRRRAPRRKVEAPAGED